MRYIQTFYSGSNPDMNSNFGWLEPKYNALSWILSANQLIKYYDDVELYTDEFGRELLIGMLGIDYTKIHKINFDVIFRDDLWATAKIKTYAEQNEPFIHIDGDFYLWNPFPTYVNNANIIVQNKEDATNDYYTKNWSIYEPKLTFLGEAMCHFGMKTKRYAYNMGVFGGCNIDFIKRYSIAALDFVNKNMDSLMSYSLNNFNVFFEQVLLYEMVHKENEKVSVLLNGEVEKCNYAVLSNFNLVPKFSDYTHLMATAKKQTHFCFDVLNNVIRFYPSYFDKIQNFYQFDEHNFLKEIVNFNTESIEILLKHWFHNPSIISKHKMESLVLRDLYIIGGPSKFVNAIEQGTDFLIKLTPFLEFHRDYVTVPMINSEHISIKLDKTDTILLYELKKTTLYSQLIQRIKSNYFDLSLTNSNKKKLLNILNKKLYSFILSKIVMFQGEL
ncbi:MAG: hypothetical protein MJ010_08665 [Paludibacteraceae bacterium]|nr:hypothetical protein [Paludibacteraceae bacterium]